jgi:hypothetical protein
MGTDLHEAVPVESTHDLVNTLLRNFKKIHIYRPRTRKMQPRIRVDLLRNVGLHRIAQKGKRSFHSIHLPTHFDS